MAKTAELLQKNEPQMLDDWLGEMAAAVRRTDLIADKEIRQQGHELVAAIAAGAKSGKLDDLSGPEWNAARELLEGISASRATRGFTPSETASFVLSLKKPLFHRIQAENAKDAAALSTELWNATAFVDSLALVSVEAFLKAKENLIKRQQEELLELSTPVVKLWDGILALPIIGTLDSARTQTVMESLLQAIVETNSKIAIIDITGVPTVDTLVAQHLIKTITAARLMGAECILSGIRPQIAQTIIHLGIDLADVITKAKLSDALALALAKTGKTVVKTSATAKG